MPCYGHSHCTLCDVPICPDCISSFSPGVEFSPYSWIMEGVAIYENGEVFNVNVNDEGLQGVLNDKDDKEKQHSMYASIKSSIFLHTYCWNLLNENKDEIPIKNIWKFLAYFNLGFNSKCVYNITKIFDSQYGLSQYYEIGDYIWLLQDPTINMKNDTRIKDIFNTMKNTEFSDSFTISGWTLQ